MHCQLDNPYVDPFSATVPRLLDLSSYQTQGFVVLPNLIPPDLISQLKSEFATLARSSASSAPLEPAFKALGSPVAFDNLVNSCSGSFLFGSAPKTIDTIGHGLHNDPGSLVSVLCSSPSLAALLERFGLAQPTCVMSKAILKPAKHGSKVPPHADDQYFWSSPESGLTLWIALDPALPHNGCIEILPGSHLLFQPGDKFSRHPTSGQACWQPPLAATAAAPAPERLPPLKQLDALPSWLPVPVHAGACIAMDRRLLHRSAANSSELPRCAITLHVIDGACSFPPDNWIPASALRRVGSSMGKA